MGRIDKSFVGDLSWRGVSAVPFLGAVSSVPPGNMLSISLVLPRFQNDC
jgi:hypothetical protein